MGDDTPVYHCIRCRAAFHTEPHIMAGRSYCCASCSVGSACEHQGIHRPPNVRKFDTMFDRFRAVVRDGAPYDEDRQASTDEREPFIGLRGRAPR